MIVKKWDPPTELNQFEALMRRLSPQHRMNEKIYTDFAKKRRALRGEKEVAYPLRFLDPQKYLIFHHLRIKDENGYFQIDTLVIYERFILILEVKNWYGTILFGENGQVTRIGDDGTETGFPNPIPQAKLQKHRLQKWLHHYGFSSIPLHFFVVISFPSTIIKSTSSDVPIPKEVIHNHNLLFSIQELDTVYSSKIITHSEMIKLSKRLCHEHIPESDKLLKRYKISVDELIKGIFCPNCMSAPMTKIYGKWLCHRCNYKSASAYMNALRDYQLLVDKEISNQQARKFLLLDSPYVTKSLLQRLNLKQTGTTRTRKYKLDLV